VDIQSLMVSQKGIERERDGEEDKAVETTWILKRRAYLSVFPSVGESVCVVW